MINEIEDAIVARLDESLSGAVGLVAIQKGIDGFPAPAAYVSTEAGRLAKIGQQSFTHSLTLYVDIIFSHLSDDRERRKGMYLILEGVLQALLLQDLSLPITPLLPQAWKNTTSEELRGQGLIVFSLELATSYTISRADDEAVTDLLRVGLNYYLKPGDDAVDASDLVTL